MEIGFTLFVLVIIIVIIWILVETKRFRHKFFAMFLIALLLFTYFSFSSVVKKNNVDIKTIPGFTHAIGLYFSWLGSLFGNFKSITGHAVNLDWSGGNQTAS